jgi:cell shape-determining protein MreD
MLDLLILGALVVYFGGVWKFWTGFNRTHFNQTLLNRVGLSLLWPALFAVNASYRRNFRRALKGS